MHTLRTVTLAGAYIAFAALGCFAPALFGGRGLLLTLPAALAAGLCFRDLRAMEG